MAPQTMKIRDAHKCLTPNTPSAVKLPGLLHAGQTSLGKTQPLELHPTIRDERKSGTASVQDTRSLLCWNPPKWSPAFAVTQYSIQAGSRLESIALILWAIRDSVTEFCPDCPPRVPINWQAKSAREPRWIPVREVETNEHAMLRSQVTAKPVLNVSDCRVPTTKVALI